MDTRGTPADLPLDPAACERARQARDARFDGRFFVAVPSTRIYCRPVCPVQPLNAEHVQFYPTAAAARAAGYRPCLRCRPEAAPGTPAWRGTGATVARALRLIAEGALDRASVTDLAARLGVGERYLRKLFLTQVGASPAVVAATRRLHLAKQLLDETALSMTAVAEASGYRSLRRFNDAVRETYGRPPQSLRRTPTAGDEGVRLRLTCRSPLEWDPMRAHFARRALPGVEQVREDHYVRTFRLGSTSGWLSVRPVPGEAAIELGLSPSAVTGALPSLVARVRRMFDLDAEPSAIAGHLGVDPVLAPLVARWPGLRLPSAFDPFEQAVRAILGQQVTVAAAVTVTARLVARLGDNLMGAPDGGPDRLFPTPEAIAEGDLSSLGVPGKRAEALQTFAAAVASGALGLSADRGPDELVGRLVALPGIGSWTAEYIALRAFGEPDAFPASDLGLLKSEAWGEERPTARELAARAERWRPWRAYAALYLWQAHGDGRTKSGERKRRP
ncbi:MAG: DNA-3-methyladenine glycosylase 2 family protein [Deltaproteobacteria bacterium]|nr:DNA-3-methyladenine glycosylase 2 family protein [Deltaproteobacteria bacterium]